MSFDIPGRTTLEREVLSGVSLGEVLLIVIGVIIVVNVMNRIRRSRMLKR
ncbi:MAG: hypothetical protein ACJAYU_000813 [Bradymonadia bacterium]|jgi:hypothetical protein